MSAARKSKMLEEAEEAAILAELVARKDVAHAESAEAQKRTRIAHVQTKLAWGIVIIGLLLGSGLVAIAAAFSQLFRK